MAVKRITIILICHITHIFSVYGQTTSTDATVTTESITTDILPAVQTTTPVPVPLGTASPLPANTDIGACSCDLTGNGCDVNCCCDPDCAETDRQAFSLCVDVIPSVNSQLCYHTDVVIVNNAPTTVNVSQPGLFCVATDNFAARNYYQVPEYVNTSYLFNATEAIYGAYSYKPNQLSTIINVPEIYKSGDPIYVLYGGDILGYLTVPSGINSGICDDEIKAVYLYNQNSECSRPVTDLSTSCMTDKSLDIRSYFEGFRIITDPTALTGQTQTGASPTTAPASFAGGTTAQPVNTGVYRDRRLLDVSPSYTPTCVNSEGISASCNFTAGTIPNPSYNATTGICSNVAKHVNYVIRHAGLSGISTIDLEYVLTDVQQQHFPLTQQFSTTFYKESKTFERSGNPGYVFGKPLLAGRLQTDPGDSTKVAISMNSNPRDRFTFLKSAPEAEQAPESDCISTATRETYREPISFGWDMRSGCHVRFSMDNITTKCDLMQQVILNILEGDTFPEYVATFGNSEIEKVGDWVPILTENEPSGSVSSDTGVCTNIVMGMHIEIIYANVGSLANPQPKIIGVSKKYEEPQNIRFQCSGAYCQPNADDLSQPFEVVSSISFIDASLPAVAVVAEVPTFQAKLPYDFFWPFYYSSANRIHFSMPVFLPFFVLSMFLLL